MASSGGEEIEEIKSFKRCSKSLKCSKEDKHPGRCNGRKVFHSFWETSRFQVRNSLKRTFEDAGEKMKADYEKKSSRFSDLESRERELLEKESLAALAEKRLQDVKDEVDTQQQKLSLLKMEFERVKSLNAPTQQTRTKRLQNPTTSEMITNGASSTRYRRRQETKHVLEYIHGGEEGAVFGAWDVVASGATEKTMDQLIGGYKRGKYLQGVFGRSVKDFNNSEEALRQAVAIKYQNFLSRRKFQLVCKTQSSVFNADKEVWLPRNIKCMETEIQLPKIASDSTVDRFVKSLDIGNVCQVGSYPGISRTVTGLVYMIIDLHLRLPRLRKQLRWFNCNENHFVLQFSDDGAPETAELGMSIGSLTCWNFDSRVRSREFHYLLHCLSVAEKDAIMEDIWRQHTDEMNLLKDSVLTVCETQCTVEFQPSADQSWQSWAANELNQAATYPSPYANVHKGSLSKMGGSIGTTGCTWQVPTQESREIGLQKLRTFEKTLPSHLSSSTRHDRKLEFMANNGLRQLGEARIGEFANLLRPEPMHSEVNSWQHLVNVCYKEALQRNMIHSFLQALSSPVEPTDKRKTQPRSSNGKLNTIAHADGAGERVRQVESVRLQEEAFKQNIPSPSTELEDSNISGCGLPFIANKIKEHYEDKEHRSNNISVRLIGEQAIALAKNFHKVIDAIEIQNESVAQKIKRQALGKAAQHLRNAGTLFNKVDTNALEIEQLKENLTTYFNLLSLFFNPSVNVTVWTMGYIIPYHASLLFEKYKIGYGILSLQAKESKHSGIKHDLALTNRSRSHDTLGKWWQVMRANYVRSFYLPEHHPMPSMYVSHYESRMPSQVKNSLYCECGRKKNDADSELCAFCEGCGDVLECAAKQELVPAVYNILKPIACPLCDERFSDKPSCDKHQTLFHSKGRQSSKHLNPKELSVPRLREELKKRSLSTVGNKAILVTRLEGELAGEG